MKKLTLLFLCLLLLFAPAPVSASSQAGALIELPELYMTLRLPSDWVYLTRDEVSNRSVMEQDFADLDALQASMPAGNSYLNMYSPDYSLYATVLMEETEESRKYWNLSNATDDFVSEWHALPSILSEDGTTKVVGSQFPPPQKKLFTVCRNYPRCHHRFQQLQCYISSYLL